MKALLNDVVVLEPLTTADRAVFFSIYASAALQKQIGVDPFLPGESPEAFTERIIHSCDYIWTIRLCSRPNLIIGDCALHHWDKANQQIEIGGALTHAHQGRGVTPLAFGLVIRFAKEYLGVQSVVGKTSPANLQAIRMVEKLGFTKAAGDEKEVLLKKIL